MPVQDGQRVVVLPKVQVEEPDVAEQHLSESAVAQRIIPLGSQNSSYIRDVEISSEPEPRIPNTQL